VGLCASVLQESLYTMINDRRECGLVGSCDWLDPVLVRGPADGLTLHVPVEEDITFVLHELACVVVIPECLEGGLVGEGVVVTDEFLEVLSGFGPVVERHLREEVVDDMEVGNIVEEEASLPAQEVSVNGSCSPTLEVPLLSTVVGHNWISMVEISYHDEPVSDFKPRNTVIFDNFPGTVNRAGISDTPDHRRNT